MLAARNIQYELAEKTRGVGVGGIGAMHLLARRTGLIETIDRRLHLLKVHKPYMDVVNQARQRGLAGPAQDVSPASHPGRRWDDGPDHG